MTDPAAEWQSGYKVGIEVGIEAAANALEADARLCDCAALERTRVWLWRMVRMEKHYISKGY